jgi:hypothetical protein
MMSDTRTFTSITHSQDEYLLVNRQDEYLLVNRLLTIRPIDLSLNAVLDDDDSSWKSTICMK